MNKMVLLFDEFLLKAIVMTENILESDYQDGEKLDSFTQNRERLIAIVEQISGQVEWDCVPDKQRQELSRKIDYLKVLDVKLLSTLQLYQEQIKKDIEQTFKQKENIKGYNLSDVK